MPEKDLYRAANRTTTSDKIDREDISKAASKAHAIKHNTKHLENNKPELDDDLMQAILPSSTKKGPVRVEMTPERKATFADKVTMAKLSKEKTSNVVKKLF